jgi:glycerophosphoryl diester phosphodiesterase
MATAARMNGPNAGAASAWRRLWLAGLLAAGTGVPGPAPADEETTMKPAPPIVIAHRGASGYVPEHTLAAYFIAVQQGADFIEPDLVMTRDGVLVARHENEIGETTDVASQTQFAARKTTRVIDGQSVSGWFTEDFTLAELKTLRARERIPQLRPASQRFDGMFEIPTLEEILALVRGIDAQREAAALAQGLPPPARIGIYPETKHPSYFDGLGLSMEGPLVAVLHKWGYIEAHAPVFIQSFETTNLKALRSMTKLRLIQLLNDSGRPFDLVLAGDPRTYRDLAAPEGLTDVAAYADGIGPNKNLLVPRTPDGALAEPTSLVADAHARGLLVHAWTFRAENYFLPQPYRSSGAQGDRGDMGKEVQQFLEAGIDGFFADHPDLGVRARDAFVSARKR